MKKLFVLAIAIVVIALGAFVPMFPPTSCNSDFHPHLDQFGGKPEEVLRVLDGIANGTVQFNAWGADARGMVELARVIVSVSYGGKMGFITFTSNPTFFFPNDPSGYMNRNTKGLNKIESKDGLKAVRNAAGCLRDAYSQLTGVKVPAPATSTTAIPVVNFQWGWLLITLPLFGGILLLKLKTA